MPTPLKRGNKKLGSRDLWVFSLPSARKSTCPGASSLCQQLCYDRSLEAFRPNMAAAREANYRLSRQEDFSGLMSLLIDALACRTVRVHGGGDYYSREYARKWLKVMRRCKATRFWFYTRSWRLPNIAPVLERMATLPNVRAWYSCDRETGVPTQVPPRVKLAWLMASPSDTPPQGTDLVFKVRRLRGVPRTRENEVRVCPGEDGVKRKAPVTCGACIMCYRPLLDDGDVTPLGLGRLRKAVLR